MSFFSDEVSRQQPAVLHFDRFWVSLTESLQRLCDEAKPEIRAGGLVVEFTMDRKCSIAYLGRKLYVAGDGCQQKLEFWITSNLTFDQLENASLISVEDRGEYELSPYPGQTFPFTKSTLKVINVSESGWPINDQLAEQLLSRLMMPRWKDTRFKEHNS